jgi:hypothetical protein
MRKTLFIGALFGIGAVVLLTWYKRCGGGPSGASPYTAVGGATGCGEWAGSNSPAYAMTAATNDISVPGVPEETSATCPGNPRKMGGGSSEGCHCN